MIDIQHNVHCTGPAVGEPDETGEEGQYYQYHQYYQYYHPASHLANRYSYERGGKKTPSPVGEKSQVASVVGSHNPQP